MLLLSCVFYSQQLNIECNHVDKNSKEAFLKKLQICMKNFDYKDETKDVRGKVIIVIFDIALII